MLGCSHRPGCRSLTTAACRDRCGSIASPSSIALVLFVLARNFVSSRPGRALVAVRDNELSALAMGIDGARYKALAFGVSAMFGGIAGSLLMMDRGIVTPTPSTRTCPSSCSSSLVVGGAHALSGAFVGVVFYLFVPYFLAEWAIDRGGMPPGLRQVVGPLLVRLDGSVSVFFGLALVLVMFFAPGGIVSGSPRRCGLVSSSSCRRSPAPVRSRPPLDGGLRLLFAVQLVDEVLGHRRCPWRSCRRALRAAWSRPFRLPCRSPGRLASCSCAGGPSRLSRIPIG